MDLADVVDELLGVPVHERIGMLRDRGISEADIKQILFAAALEEEREPRLAPADEERYQLLDPIAEGATARVWSAHDTRLKRNVALKIFHEDDEERVADALAEARLASQVRSPYVISVFDVSSESRMIAMELVVERRTRGPVRHAQAARWMVDAAHGIADAHQRGVFHRDLKPRNLIIDDNRALVGDFGLAAIRGTLTGGDTVCIAASDRANTIAGTQAYLAPEVACGEVPLDNANSSQLVPIDVWGLGATLFEFLVGHPPWIGDGKTPTYQVAATATSSPADKLPGTIPAQLRRILRTSLALTPSARFPSAAAMAEALGLFLGRRPTLVDPWWMRPYLFARRNIALTVALVAFVIFGAVVTARYASWNVHKKELEHQNADQLQVIDDMRKAVGGLEGLLRQGATDKNQVESALDAVKTAMNAQEQLLVGKNRGLAGQLEQSKIDNVQLKGDLSREQQARKKADADRTKADADLVDEKNAHEATRRELRAEASNHEATQRRLSEESLARKSAEQALIGSQTEGRRLKEELVGLRDAGVPLAPADAIVTPIDVATPDAAPPDDATAPPD